MRTLTVLAVLIASAGPASAAGPLDAPGAVKTLTCSACHGPAGQSPSDAMPIIAGIEPAYFKKAIEDHAAGRRSSPEMEPYAKMVKELGLEEVAGYFAARPRRPTGVPVDAAAVERGRKAAQQCPACHGADGRGDPARMVPDLRASRPAIR